MIMQIYSAVPRQQAPWDQTKDQAVTRDFGGGRSPYGQRTAGTGVPLVDEE